MYIRKFWRDNRLSFLIHLCLMVAGAASAGLVPALVFDNKTGWSLIRGGDAQWVAGLWSRGLKMLMVSGIALGMATGLVLGASGVGNEFHSGGNEYLLTRPRSRAYFLWTGWLAGMAQLAGICLIWLLAGVALLFSVTGRMLTWDWLMAFPVALVSCAVTFGLSYFFTILCRDGRLGLNVSFALVGAYGLTAGYLNVYYQIDLPFVWSLLRGQPTPANAPLGLLALWSAVAVALPAGAQPFLQHSDV